MARVKGRRPPPVKTQDQGDTVASMFRAILLLPCSIWYAYRSLVGSIASRWLPRLSKGLAFF